MHSVFLHPIDFPKKASQSAQQPMLEGATATTSLFANVKRHRGRKAIAIQGVDHRAIL
jgi:hypothetical protein